MNNPTPAVTSFEEAVKKYRSLGVAVKQNDLAAAQFMLPRFKESEQYDAHALTQLLWANAGTLTGPMASFLVREGGDVRYRIEDKEHSRNGISAVFKAAELGNVAMLEGLIQHSLIDVDETDHAGQTMMMRNLRAEQAPQRGQMIQMLLNEGADVDLQDMVGNTALHYAAGECQFEAVVRLVEHGANPSIENSDGSNAGQMVPESMEEPWDPDALYEMLGAYERAYQAGQTRSFEIPDAIAKQVLMERGELYDTGERVEPAQDPQALPAPPPFTPPKPKMF